MKTAEEIFNDVLKCDDIPYYETVIEINCFMSLRELTVQYQNQRLSKEQCTKIKTQIFGTYENNKREYEFKKSILDESLKNIEKTEDIRCMLRTQLKEESPKSLEVALKLIELYSGEKWLKDLKVSV